MSRARTGAAGQVGAAAPIFAALGDETRLRLLVRLSSGRPESIARLSAKAPVSRQAVKKHLDVLSRAGLVQGNRRGREHLWQLRPQRLGEARGFLDRISRQWDEALDRLKGFVEGTERT
jgi:DNA-binding transcriptional ArsR family regulator